MAYGSIICDLWTEILIYDSYWEITSKDFFETVRLTEGFFSNDHKNCPLSVVWRCPFYREFHYSKSYTKTIGACEKCLFYGGIRLTEVSVSRELTVVRDNAQYFSYGPAFYYEKCIRHPPVIKSP